MIMLFVLKLTIHIVDIETTNQVLVFSTMISEWNCQFWFTVLYRAGQNTAPVTLPLRVKKI